MWISTWSMRESRVSFLICKPLDFLPESIVRND
jgi:hypothetical protein